MDKNNNLPETKEFEKLLKSLQDKYTDGWNPYTTELLKEIYYNNHCTVDQVREWGKWIEKKDTRTTNVRRSPGIKFFNAMFFKAIFVRKDNSDNINDNDFMLKKCKDMEVKEIYNLGKKLNDIHMGRKPNTYGDTFDTVHMSFLVHWDDLLHEIDNIVSVHGGNVFKDDLFFKTKIEDVKKAIVKKESFEKFWDVRLRKINYVEEITEQFEKGYCSFEDREVSGVDCNLCNKGFNRENCGSFEEKKGA